MPKPFKKIFNKKPKAESNTDHHSNNYYHHTPQSRSYSVYSHRKYHTKSKSKSKPKSDSHSSKSVKLKKLIDTRLLQQYEEYVKHRVEMFQTRAFPHQVIHQLPQYRADLSYI